MDIKSCAPSLPAERGLDLFAIGGKAFKQTRECFPRLGNACQWLQAHDSLSLARATCSRPWTGRQNTFSLLILDIAVENLRRLKLALSTERPPHDGTCQHAPANEMRIAPHQTFQQSFAEVGTMDGASSNSKYFAL
jgi:hypothetical protein